MLLTFGVVAGMAYSLARGGELSRLAQPGFRGLWLPIAALALQLGELFLYRATGYTALHPLVTVLSYAMAALFVVLNRRARLGATLFGLGTLCNFLVIAANDFHMPVSRRVYQFVDASHRPGLGYLISDDAKLRFLGDILYVPIPILGGMMSLGDIFLAVGAALLCDAVMREKRR